MLADFGEEEPQGVDGPARDCEADAAANNGERAEKHLESGDPAQKVKRGGDEEEDRSADSAEDRADEGPAKPKQQRSRS